MPNTASLSKKSSLYALWAALLAVFFSIASFGGVYSWAWGTADVFLYLALLTIVAARIKAGKILPLPAIFIPCAAFFLLGAFQWGHGTTAYRGETLTGLLQLAGCGAIFYLAILGSRRTKNINLLAWALWAFTGALSAEAILQHFTSPGVVYWVHLTKFATPVGPFIYHNHFAGCIDLLLPISIASIWSGENKPGRHDTGREIRRGLIPALALAAAIISQSRGGLFALSLEAILGVWIFKDRILKSKSNLRNTFIVAAALLSLTFLAGWTPIMRRVLRLGYQDVSAVDRVEVAKTCLSIWKANFWTGTGFNAFAAVYPSFQTFDSGQRWLAAHNDYAQAAAETGLVGLICVFLFLILYLRDWRRTIRSVDRPCSLTINAAAIGTIGFLFHSFGDFLFHAPGDALLFFLLAGVVVGTAHSSRTNDSSTMRQAMALPANKQSCPRPR